MDKDTHEIWFNLQNTHHKKLVEIMGKMVDWLVQNEELWNLTNEENWFGYDKVPGNTIGEKWQNLKIPIFNREDAYSWAG